MNKRVEFVNLTGSPVVLYDEGGKEILHTIPSVGEATVTTPVVDEQVGTFNGIPVIAPVIRDVVVGLPDQSDPSDELQKVFIVTEVVAAAVFRCANGRRVPYRQDVVVLSWSTRVFQGDQLVGYRGLRQLRRCQQ
jgi:hypothetical protein